MKFKLNIQGSSFLMIICHAQRKPLQNQQKKIKIMNSNERITYSLGLLVLVDSLVRCVGEINFWSQFRDNVMAAPILQCRSYTVSFSVVKLQTKE